MVGGDMHKFDRGGGGPVSGHTPRMVEGGKGKRKLVPISAGEGGLESEDPITTQRYRRREGEMVAKQLGLHPLAYGGGA